MALCLSVRENLGTVYALSDTDGDNYAETVRVIADNLDVPNGVAFRDGDLYVAERNRIIRYDEIESRLSSPPAPTVVIDMLPGGASHWWKFLRFGPDGKLYVPVGAPCNVCKKSDERYAAILRMNPDGSSLEVFAHGVRNTVGFDWHPGRVNSGLPITEETISVTTSELLITVLRTNLTALAVPDFISVFRIAMERMFQIQASVQCAPAANLLLPNWNFPPMSRL